MGSQCVAAVGTVLYSMDLLLKETGGLTASLSQGRGWVQGRGISAHRCSLRWGIAAAGKALLWLSMLQTQGSYFGKGPGLSLCVCTAPSSKLEHTGILTSAKPQVKAGGSELLAASFLGCKALI